MTEISNTEDIRELTSEEIAAVAGGSFNGSGGNPLLSKIDHILDCLPGPLAHSLDRIVDCLLSRSAPSDIRMKHDVALVGRLDNGLGFYRFSYIGSDDAFVGVMAQEVEEVMPTAVECGDDGYLRVKYDMLGLSLQTWDEWVASGQKIPTTKH
jgi:hypothetical protein